MKKTTVKVVVAIAIAMILLITEADSSEVNLISPMHAGAAKLSNETLNAGETIIIVIGDGTTIKN